MLIENEEPVPTDDHENTREPEVQRDRPLPFEGEDDRFDEAPDEDPDDLYE
jgi:hypothetical protein